MQRVPVEKLFLAVNKIWSLGTSFHYKIKSGIIPIQVPMQDYNETLGLLRGITDIVPMLRSRPADRAYTETLRCFVDGGRDALWREPNAEDVAIRVYQRFDAERLAASSQQLFEAVVHAFEDAPVYFVADDQHKYLRPLDQQFDHTRVLHRFPSIRSELEDALNALAFGLSTGAVFHALRVLERALKAYCLSLGLKDTHARTGANWGALLGTIHREIDRREKQDIPWQNQNPDVARQIYGTIDAIRGAWRNSTMHVENRYTQREAEELVGLILAAVRRVAHYVDEAGNPPA